MGAASDAQVDWEDPTLYAYTQALSPGAWGWEFLRRNRAYRDAAIGVRSANPVACALTKTEPLVPSNASARWGLLAFADPECSARDATVLWQPEIYPSVLPVQARDFDGTQRSLQLTRLACRVSTYSVTQRLHHIFLGSQDRWLQLLVHGELGSHSLQLHTDAIVAWGSVERRTLLLRRLAFLAEHGHLPAHLYPRSTSAVRLVRVLQALDGFLAGASQRDIAVALFGSRRVASDWGEPTGHLRDHVRRTIRRGRFLMTRGYLQLLR